MKKIIESTETLIETANFFHEVAHLKDLDITEGMTINELAKKANKPVPSSLRDAVIHSTSATMSKPRKGHPLLTVDYGEPLPGEGTIEFKKCIEVKSSTGPATGKIKVCIDCSVTKLKCKITIEITGTIEIG